MLNDFEKDIRLRAVFVDIKHSVLVVVTHFTSSCLFILDLLDLLKTFEFSTILFNHSNPSQQLRKMATSVAPFTGPKPANFDEVRTVCYSPFFKVQS
jgi:hypothetical protein